MCAKPEVIGLFIKMLGMEAYWGTGFSSSSYLRKASGSDRKLLFEGVGTGHVVGMGRGGSLVCGVSTGCGTGLEV